jgi:hypothetical protein
MWLEQSSPLGVFSKILLASPLFTHSEEFCYVWEIWDTRLDCSAFQLTPLGQNIGDSGCSLWRTPRAEFDSGKHRGQTDTLHSAAKLWPTPTVPNGGRRNPEGTSITGKKPDGGKAQIDLREFAIRLWPTPTCEDTNRTPEQYMDYMEKTGRGRLINDLTVAAKLSGDSQGSLNVHFVEELMGYEIDHSALKRSATQSFRSKSTRFLKRSPEP